MFSTTGEILRIRSKHMAIFTKQVINASDSNLSLGITVDLLPHSIGFHWPALSFTISARQSATRGSKSDRILFATFSEYL